MTANTNPETIINEPGRGFLGQLASSSRYYPYQGRRQFLIDFEAEWQHHHDDTSGNASEWFLVTGVDNHIFENEFLDPIDQKTPWTSWCSFDPHLQVLLVKMPNSSAHETASMTFDKILLKAVEPTGLEYALREIGRTTHSSSFGVKEADQAWKPSRPPPGRSQNWPSVVLEVAYSETESKLISDVRFWMRASESDVKAVLTLRINRQQPKIKIEKWVNNSSNNRHHLDQTVTISKTGNNRIKLSNAPLTIGFEELFLRPASIPREKDIELDAESLQYLATEIWEVQGF